MKPDEATPAAQAGRTLDYSSKYFRSPKPATHDEGVSEAWWYVDNNGIGVYATVGGYTHRIEITPRQIRTLIKHLTGASK